MEAERIMTGFLQLRHRLIPYLYTMNYLTHLQGLPLLQPMYYRHDTEEAYHVPNQYYFGTQMIVCPITKPVSRRTLVAEFDAWLPEGEYFDFFTGQYYRGGRRMKLYRGLENIPVLVPAGGVIPMAKDGADGSFDLYEDRTEEEGKADPVVTHFEFTAGKTAEVHIQIEGEPEGVIPDKRCYDIHIRGIAEPSEIVFADNASVQFNQSYHAERKELGIRFCGENLKDINIRILLQDEKITDPEKERVIFNLLHRAQIEYSLKADIFEAVCSEKNRERLIGKLVQMEMDDDLTGAVVEQIIMDC